mmetsp:Transcript_21286/g.18897  ORF Transcript_21286/g.18897 Transcript_21286/m.18897 type:complete len:81 (-) Transcript_21286:321-563(-)
MVEENRVEMAFRIIKCEETNDSDNNNIKYISKCLTSFMVQYKTIKNMIFECIDKLSEEDEGQDIAKSSQIKEIYDQVIEK